MIELSVFWKILTFAGTAGVFAAVTTQAILIMRERKNGQKAAAALALKCAIILEKFAHDCIDNADRIDRLLGQSYDPSKITVDIPVLDDYPEDAHGWISMPRPLSGRLMNIRMSATDSNRQLCADYDAVGREELTYEYRDENLILASDAWFVASELRRDYKFPEYGKIDARDPDTSTVYYLEHAVNEIEARRRIKEKQQANIVEELSS